MFAAGTDTTYTGLTWAMAELIKNSRVLNKLQEKIRMLFHERDQVIEEDTGMMLNLKALVKETKLRLHPPLPLLVLKGYAHKIWN